MERRYNVSLKTIKNNLSNKFPKATNIFLIATGEMSEVYEFESGGIEYVVRINRERRSFDKDRFYFENYSQFITIPEIIEIGEIQELYYCVSPKVSGVQFDKLSLDEKLSAKEDFYITLDLIHNLSSAGDGYGYVDESGKGYEEAWFKQFSFNHPDPDSW